MRLSKAPAGRNCAPTLVGTAGVRLKMLASRARLRQFRQRTIPHHTATVNLTVSSVMKFEKCILFLNAGLQSQ